MNTENWNYYYKLALDGNPCESNLLYSPLINPEKTLMCMHYKKNEEYQKYKNVDQETINFFFEREVKNLIDLAHFDFTPKLYDIDYKNQKIFIEFTGETLSQIVNVSNRNIDTEFPNWKSQIFNIIRTIYSNGYYKMTLYPHCFFIKDGILKTIDYYGVVLKNERYLERKVIESIIGNDGAYRFNDSTTDGIIDFKVFFEITLTTHLTKYWKNIDFTSLYEEFKNDTLESSSN